MNVSPRLHLFDQNLVKTLSKLFLFEYVIYCFDLQSYIFRNCYFSLQCHLILPK